MFIKSLRAGLAACLCAVTTLAAAQTWPDRPIRIVVPAPPGGSIDMIARIMADAMQPDLGQPIIVDNKPGGLTMIGVNELLGAPRDGYTVMLHLNGAVSEIPHLIKPRFDPFKDIKPIAELARSGLLFVGGPQLPATTLKEVISYVKANPGKVSIASYSAGTVYGPGDPHVPRLRLRRLHDRHVLPGVRHYGARSPDPAHGSLSRPSLVRVRRGDRGRVRQPYRWPDSLIRRQG